MAFARIALLLAIASSVFTAAPAQAVIYLLDTSIAGDVVVVTLELTDVTGGDAVDLTATIETGEGDLRGVLGNLVDETIQSDMAATDLSAVLTNWAFDTPASGWDWTLLVGENASAGQSSATLHFRLTGTGLDVSQLTSASNGNLVFGIEIEDTNGASGFAKMELPVGTPPISSIATVAITSPAGGSTATESPVTVAGTITGSNATVSVNGVSASVSAGTFSASVPIAEGSNSVTAIATNPFGSTTDSITLELDSTPPTVVVTHPLEGATIGDSSIEVSGTVQDASAPIAVLVNFAPVAVSGGVFAKTVSLSQGNNVIDVKAQDGVGNVVTVIRNVTYDPGIPALEIVSPLDGATTSAASIEVSGTASDPDGVALVTVNGQPATLTGDNWTISVPLSLGSNSLVAVAEDTLGHAATDSVDVTRGDAPVLAVSSPVDGTFSNVSSIVVTGTVTGTEPLSVDVNGTPATVATDTFSAQLDLAEGGNALVVTATNAFGNVQESVAVTLDTMPPVVAINDPSDGSVLSDDTVFVSGTVNDASPIVDLQLNSTSLPAGPTFGGSTTLIEGQNVLEVTAIDAAGNAGSAAVTVTLSASASVDVTISTPVESEIVSSSTVDVAGTVTPSDALVTVNGIVAFVTGTQYVATGVPLAEGSNALTATAVLGTESATASVNVTVNRPPEIQISAPSDGSLVRESQVDVEGFVSDPAAVVYVNDVLASVDSTGRFVGLDIAVESGTNSIRAIATDALGASGEDEITVERDDSAPGELRLVLVKETYAFGDWDEDSPVTQVFENVEEYRQDLASAGMSPEEFPSGVGAITLGVENFRIFAFSEDPGTVSIPVAFSVLGSVLPSWDTKPIDLLPDEFVFQFGLLDPELIPEIVPHDFEARHFAIFDVAVFRENDPPDSLDIDAFLGTSFATVPIIIDIERPEVQITTPGAGTTVAGDVITVTGVVTRDGMPPGEGDRLPFGRVGYELADDFGILAEGTVPLIGGRFAIPGLQIAPGSNQVSVFAVSSAGQSADDEATFTSDPSAPLVALVSPLDGASLAIATVPVDLNFSATTTLVSVNGVPDGRSFGPGFAASVVDIPLLLGSNSVELELDSAGTLFELGFTVHRVDSIGEIRITSPADGALTPEASTTVTGTVPVGTPFVEVNGIAAQIAPDLASFEVVVPLAEGINSVSAVAYPLGQTTSVSVTRDTTPPVFESIFPAETMVSDAAELAFIGVVSEAATVSVSGPQGSATVDTSAQQFSPGNPTLGIPNLTTYPFELAPIQLDEGANALTFTATDRAGNSTTLNRVQTRATAGLTLDAPADGAQIAGLAVSVLLDVLVDVVIDAVYVGEVRLPAFEGLASVPGSLTLPDLPLVPGVNALRVIYHRPGGGAETLRFSYESTASSSSTATLTGVVSDAQTGSPIQGALVSVTPTGGGTRVVVTGSGGTYALLVDAGSVDGTVGAEGYAPSSFATTLTAGQTTTADVSLNPTGLPSLPNEVAIVVPPDGTVTDFEALTVVGTVFNDASTVSVNGVPAEIIGNRFIARGVALAMGANTIDVTATVPGLPTVTETVDVTRSNEPVLDVQIFSPPPGSVIPGSGLVVRGFVSASEARTFIVDGGFVPVEEGVFEAFEVVVPVGESTVAAMAQVPGVGEVVQASVPVTVTSEEPALLLEADPTSGVAGLESTLTLFFGGASFPVERIDFDLDGDRHPEVIDSPVAEQTVVVSSEARLTLRAFVTTPQGVEFSARTRIEAHGPSVVLNEFALGNPVDLAPAPDGDLYVLDSAEASIARYDSDGGFLSEFGSAGAGAEDLSVPQALAVGDDGRIFVADTGNDRIQVFASDGTFDSTIGQGSLSSPVGVTVDGDLLVVSDAGNAQLRFFGVDGGDRGAIPFENPRGLSDSVTQGVLVASASEGLRTFGDGTLRFPIPLSLLPPQGAIAAPVDVAAESSVVAVIDASDGQIVLLDRDLSYRRTIEGLAPAPQAVLPGARFEQETLFVADGTRVVELSVPTPSPLPVLANLRDALAVQDIEGALSNINPLRRDHYRELYELIQADLPAEAAAMADVEIELLRDDRAMVMLRRTEDENGTSVVRRYPMFFSRGEDGAWEIFDY